MARPCQDCLNRPATIQTKHHHGRIRSRLDHDLCGRCWRKRMDATRAAQLIPAKMEVIPV